MVFYFTCTEPCCCGTLEIFVDAGCCSLAQCMCQVTVRLHRCLSLSDCTPAVDKEEESRVSRCCFRLAALVDFSWHRGHSCFPMEPCLWCGLGVASSLGEGGRLLPDSSGISDSCLVSGDSLSLRIQIPRCQEHPCTRLDQSGWFSDAFSTVNHAQHMRPSFLSRQWSMQDSC